MTKPKRRPPRHVIGGPGLPKGATPLPTGGYTLGSSRLVARDRHGKQRGIRITPVYCEHPDVKRLVQVLLDVAKADAANAEPGLGRQI